MEFTSLRKPSVIKSFQKAITTEVEYTPKVVRFKASVGVVVREINDSKEILLGKCVLKDDREGMWCFPGGGVESGENVYQAGIREVQEESHVVVRPIYSPVIMDEDLPGVAFIQFEYLSGEPIPNKEFEDFQWFGVYDLPDDIFPQNRRILDYVKTLPIVISRKDFINEHEKLLKVLKKKDEDELDEEYKEQKQELDNLVKGSFEKARELPVGTINKWKEMKMPDGTWKYVGDQGKDHHAVKHLFESGQIKQTYLHQGVSREKKLKEVEPIYTFKPGGGILFTPTGDPNKSQMVEIQEVDPGVFIRFKMDDGTIGAVDLRRHKLEDRFIVDSYEPPVKSEVITVEKQEQSKAQVVHDSEEVKAKRRELYKRLTEEKRHEVASYLESLPSQTVFGNSQKKKVANMLGLKSNDNLLDIRWVESNGYIDNKMPIVLYGGKKVVDGVTSEGLKKRLGLVKPVSERNLFKISKGDIDYDF